MDRKHPTRKELEGIVLGRLPAKRARAVILHLLQGCEPCNLAFLPYLPPQLPCDRETPTHAQLSIYDAPIDRALAAVGLSSFSDSVADDRQVALDLLASGGLEALVDAPPNLSGRHLFEILLERSWALRRENPSGMVALARGAVLWSQGLRKGELSAEEIADLRCRAWAELGNAYRVADSLDLAESALGCATSFLVLGTHDELLGARFFEVLASYYSARRFFDLACSVLAMVTAIYQRLGNSHLAGRALVSQGIYRGYQGHAEDAIELVSLGLSFVDQENDPGLVLSALQANAWFLVDCGRFRDAQLALFDLRRRGLDVGGRLGELKLRWLEGHIYAGLNKLDQAARALAQVKEGFEEAGLGYKAALAGLELAAVWLRQHRGQEAERLALQCADVFIALQIRGELMASILVLRKAAETQYLNLTILQHAIHVLHKEDRNPTASPLEEP